MALPFPDVRKAAEGPRFGEPARAPSLVETMGLVLVVRLLRAGFGAPDGGAQVWGRVSTVWLPDAASRGTV